MRSRKPLIITLLAIALTCWMENTTAQTTKTTLSEQEFRDLVSRLDQDAQRFTRSADKALDKSGYEGTPREDELNRHLNDFRNSTGGLIKYKDTEQARGSAEDVMRRGVAIEKFLKRNPLDGVQGDWMALRWDLQQLAHVYGVDLANLQSAAGTKVGATDVRNLVKHINDGANQYKKSLDATLDNSPLDGTTIEDEINQYMKDFRESTDRLENHYKEETAAQDAAEVLRRAKRIDGYMRRYPISTEAQNHWVSVRTDIERLAGLYSLNLQWQ